MPRRPPRAASPSRLLPPSTLTDSLPLPRIIVFDLDYTLWPFWADTHPTPPFRATPSAPAPAPAAPTTTPHPPSHPVATTLLDRHGAKFTTYPYTPTLLTALAAQGGIAVCAASRTQSPSVAGSLLREIMFHIPPGEAEAEGGATTTTVSPMASFFSHFEIYPARSKSVHFSRIKSWFLGSLGSGFAGGNGDGEGLDWRDVLFFDDESRNRDVERELGVVFVLVDMDEGVSRRVFDEGVWEWRRRRGVGREREKAGVD